MEKMEQLWPGGYRLLYDDALFPPGTDSFLLSAFPRLGRCRRVCDLGAGTGLLGLLLLARAPGLEITNVEILPQACRLAERNAAINGLEGSVRCLQADLRDRKALPQAGSFDLVVANPPYFNAADGYTTGRSPRDTARFDTGCTLAEVLSAARYLLRWGGQLALVFPVRRMAELMETARQQGLEPKRLRLVQHSAAAAPSLLLLECRRGGRTGLTVEAPLILTGPDGKPTEEVDHIYLRDKR